MTAANAGNATGVFAFTGVENLTGDTGADAFNIDASVRYQITRQIEVSIEGINLTDDYRDRFTDFDANRNYENNHFGRTILFGARFRL